MSILSSVSGSGGGSGCGSGQVGSGQVGLVGLDQVGLVGLVGLCWVGSVRSDGWVGLGRGSGRVRCLLVCVLKIKILHV